MSDYGHDLKFGLFITPVLSQARQVMELSQLADREGIDLVTFQDHPYQPAFADTWMLMSQVAALTQRVTIAPNVTNLPLRGPGIIARSAATLDQLSGGRFELGIGSGAFWDGIEAMGGRRLSPGQAIQALREAITIIRQLWDTEETAKVAIEGEFYRAVGAKRGPAPARPIDIWVGAYGPKMLQLTAEVGDGWVPSVSFLPDGIASLGELSARLDAAAVNAGRQPGDIRRLLNVMELNLGSQEASFGHGSVEQIAEQLTAVALDYGVSTFIFGGDDPQQVPIIANEIAPAVREAVATERALS